MPIPDVDFFPHGRDDNDTLEGSLATDLLEHLEVLHWGPTRPDIRDPVEVEGTSELNTSIVSG